MDRLWHGGFPGLRPGQILDASHARNHLSCCPVCADRAAGVSGMDPLPGQADRVYLTADREYARYYASLVHLGDLYQVEPIGDLLISQEDRFPTWTAASAVVTAVYARSVRLTDGQRRALMKRWTEADAHADGWAEGLAALSPADRSALHRRTMNRLWGEAEKIAREARRRGIGPTQAGRAAVRAPGG